MINLRAYHHTRKVYGDESVGLILSLNLDSFRGFITSAKALLIPRKYIDVAVNGYNSKYD